MPKLLQIDTCLGVGSTGRIAETIGLLASNRGWECYMAHGARYIGRSSMQSYQVSTKKDEYAHYVKSLLFDAHGLGSKRATRLFVEWIKTLSPDVIHIHNIHGYWLNYEILFTYLRESRIPVVWTFHDCWAITGRCAMFTSMSCEKWKTECNHCPSLDLYPRTVFIDNSRKNYLRKKGLFTAIPNLTIVSVSKWLDGLVEQSFLKEKSHVVISNGVDLSVFCPRYGSEKRTRERYGLCDKKIILSVADKWSEEIGFSDIPKLRSLLDDSFVIVLVGVNEEQRKSLPEGVVGILHTNSRDELAELYTAADITLMPQFIATFGLVTVESMTCGTPAVVYAPAAAEVVGDTGFVVPARDIPKLAQIICTYFENGGKANYSEKCINRVKENYNEIANYSSYVDLYESLIKEEVV